MHRDRDRKGCCPLVDWTGSVCYGWFMESTCAPRAHDLVGFNWLFTVRQCVSVILWFVRVTSAINIINASFCILIARSRWLNLTALDWSIELNYLNRLEIEFTSSVVFHAWSALFWCGPRESNHYRCFCSVRDPNPTARDKFEQLLYGKVP
jgi:hypothetical protein